MPQPHGGAFGAIAISLLTLFAPALAIEIPLAPPGADAWHPLEFPKIPRHTTYTVVHEDGLPAFKAQADCSASAMYLPATDIDLKQTRRLRWRWKIEKGIDVSDERAKAGDDFAARVYVMFQFDPAHASLWERAGHALGTKIYGDIIPGKAINYVWSSHQPSGAKWDNPSTSASKMISLGSGPLLQWTDEVVDVVADFIAFFGYDPPPLLAVSVMTDTDNTCQRATAYYAGFSFLPTASWTVE